MAEPLPEAAGDARASGAAQRAGPGSFLLVATGTRQTGIVLSVLQGRGAENFGTLLLPL